MPLPEIHMQARARARFMACLEQARVVLEFGMGGSTVAAARQGCLVQSVESDSAWVFSLRRALTEAGLDARLLTHFVDIGAIGAWGRPLTREFELRWPGYATDIWQREWFHPPDLVLIDGRFRAACFVACCVGIRRPTRVLFDDYLERPEYHVIEQFFRPIGFHDTMAEFVLHPYKWPSEVSDKVNSLALSVPSVADLKVRVQAP